MNMQIYVSFFVRSRVETSTPHYTNTCAKLTIVTRLSFSERIAIADLFHIWLLLHSVGLETADGGDTPNDTREHYTILQSES